MVRIRNLKNVGDDPGTIDITKLRKRQNREDGKVMEGRRHNFETLHR